jgi:hypothetical protein
LGPLARSVRGASWTTADEVKGAWPSRRRLPELQATAMNAMPRMAKIPSKRKTITAALLLRRTGYRAVHIVRCRMRACSRLVG